MSLLSQLTGAAGEPAADRLSERLSALLTANEGVPLAIMGIVVVFAALCLVIAFIVLLPRIAAAVDRLAAREAGHADPAVASAVSSGTPAEHFPAVIAAAVAAVISEPHRIIHAKRLSTDPSWTSEGRRLHHQSHRTHDRW